MRIRNGFEKYFCLRSNLSSDNIKSALRPGLKTDVENYIFWSEIGSGFEEPRGTPPPRIPRSTPPPAKETTVYLARYSQIFENFFSKAFFPFKVAEHSFGSL